VRAHDPTATGTDDAFNLRKDEVGEQDHGEDAEVDNDPVRDRVVSVIGLTPEYREYTDKAWMRRQWEVLPLRTTAARRNSKLL
jgi:WD repeat-containing protein 23